MASNSSVNTKILGAVLGLMMSVVALGGVVQPMALSCPLDEKPVGTCFNYTCNTATGMWVQAGKKANGSPCDDNRACTTGDKCTNGVCGGTSTTNVCCSNGTPIATNPCCTDGIPLSDTSCSDGNACTRTDTCQAGSCVGSNPVSCVASDQCHVAGVCDPATGTCTNPVKGPGITCGDTDNCACSVAGVCLFTSDKTLYCYDKAGNQTAMFTRSAGAACLQFSCP